MSSYRHLLTLFMPALLSVLVGCAAPHGPDFDPYAKESEVKLNPDAKPLPSEAFKVELTSEPVRREWLMPPTKDYPLGPGDKVEIEIFGEDNSRETTFVTPDGQVYFHSLPGFHAMGKTTSELRQDIQKSLLSMYRHPMVGVTMTDANSQRVMIMGRVNGPGSYPLKRPMRVLDVIGLAGGLSASDMNGTTEELADLEHSFLKRGDQLMPVSFTKLLREGDMQQNIYLEGGDFIYLPSSLTSEIYIIGNVNRSRSAPFRPNMSLVSAYGQALGAKPGADLKHVTIVRGSLIQPRYATVDLHAILTGQKPDIRLEAGDIIYFPVASGINPMTYAKAAVQTFTRAIGASDSITDYPAAIVNSTAIGLGGRTGGRMMDSNFPAP
jgi:polysaccharide biosynthesis/export protein